VTPLIRAPPDFCQMILGMIFESFQGPLSMKSIPRSWKFVP
jgi:hypothetical protein